MNETHWTDAPSTEQTQTAAAADSAASLAKGAMFTNDDTTDDPGVASNGEALAPQDSADPAKDSGRDE